MLRRILTAVCILSASCLVLYLYWPGNRAPRTAATVTAPVPIGGPFTLTDTKGNAVTETALEGHLSLIYFGYTYCPDICPLVLENMTKAIEMAGPAAETALPVFITIDPDRDTSEVMAAYIGHFHPRMLGLRGTLEQTRAVEKAFHVFAAKSETVGPPVKAGGAYVMDHTGYIYLMDKSGKYVTLFQMDASAADMAARLRREAGAP